MKVVSFEHMGSIYIASDDLYKHRQFGPRAKRVAVLCDHGLAVHSWRSSDDLGFAVMSTEEAVQWVADASSEGA